MKVYIAGKITGNPMYKEEFDFARKKLTERGHVVLNPASLPVGMSRADYMRICFAMIDTCDFALFLPNYKDSNGAKVERAYCEYVGIPIEDFSLYLRK